MTSMACLARTLQRLFTTVADEVARESGFVRRRRKLTGACFAQTLVFGLLGAPDATLRQLQQAAATAGTAASVQAIAQRSTQTAATFLHHLLERAVATLVRGEPVAIPLLARFPAIVVMDSSVISLPAALATVWRGCGNNTPQAALAALKLHLRYDLCAGGLDVLTLHDGTASDRRAPSQTAPLPPGALRLSDRGFFAAAAFRAVVAAGGHFLTHPVPRLTICPPAGTQRSLARFLAARRTPVVDLQLSVGSKDPLACRCIAVRVPAAVAEQRRAKERAAAQREGRAPRASVLAVAGWTVLLTSLPRRDLSVREALVLARLRWQVELTFKLWKSAGNELAAWRTADPWRLLCTVYAKLLGCLVQHWLLLSSCWAVPDKSLVAAATTIRARSPALLSALRRGLSRLREELAEQRRIIGTGCRLQKRSSHPACFQLLLNPYLTPVN
jgi:hypothetical protein